MRAPQNRLILYLNMAHLLSRNFIELDTLKCDCSVFCNYARFEIETAHCVLLVFYNFESQAVQTIGFHTFFSGVFQLESVRIFGVALACVGTLMRDHQPIHVFVGFDIFYSVTRVFYSFVEVVVFSAPSPVGKQG